jgi:hypothetical protein
MFNSGAPRAANRFRSRFRSPFKFPVPFFCFSLWLAVRVRRGGQITKDLLTNTLRIPGMWQLHRDGRLAFKAWPVNGKNAGMDGLREIGRRVPGRVPGSGCYFFF